MTRMIRNVCWLIAAGLLVASLAHAGLPPDPIRATLQSPYIDVEGSTAGRPDNCSDLICSDWLAIIRDFANTPIAGATVIIDFSNCPDIQISCDQLHSVTGQTALAGKQVMGTTDAQGRVSFRIQGAASATLIQGSVISDGTNSGIPCASIYADGVPLAALSVIAYDVNGIGSPNAAVNAVDVSLVAAEVVRVALGAQGRERDDYNHSGTISAADVSIAARMAAQQAIGTGSQTTAPYCP